MTVWGYEFYHGVLKVSLMSAEWSTKFWQNILSITVFKLNMGRPEKLRSELDLKPGACFSKVLKLFERILGDIILFVSSKGRRLKARNVAVIFIFIPFTTYEKTSFTE